MGRLLAALVVGMLLATGCLGSAAQPSGRLSVVVTLGSTAHTYTLKCGPAGGTMPGAESACGALADYLQHRSDRGRFCTGFVPDRPSAIVTGGFGGHHMHLRITPGSWCGVSDALMRDYWILSTFPCSTTVFHYADQHAYSKGIAPERCLRGSS